MNAASRRGGSSDPEFVQPSAEHEVHIECMLSHKSREEEADVTYHTRDISIPGGRLLKVTPVLDTYWRFAAERQHIFHRRLGGEAPPWTDDPVLARHRFTNVYRAADRASQYLIRNVLYEGPQQPDEILFRTLLFRFFNRIATWEALVHRIGPPTWSHFDAARYRRVLDGLFATGAPLYSAAYIIPSPAFGSARKHQNHLALLEHMMRTGAPRQVADSRSLEDLFTTLKGYPSLGTFLAFQFAIDLNYSDMIDFQEQDFVVAGPGARNGIRKCFADTGGFAEADIIRIVAERADCEFGRHDLQFRTLWGRPLQLVDCQNLFCEVDKYARVAHPHVKGVSDRTRIKRRFSPNRNPLPQWYPPKWHLSVPAAPVQPQAPREPCSRRWISVIATSTASRSQESTAGLEK